MKLFMGFSAFGCTMGGGKKGAIGAALNCYFGGEGVSCSSITSILTFFGGESIFLTGESSLN